MIKDYNQLKNPGKNEEKGTTKTKIRVNDSVITIDNVEKGRFPTMLCFSCCTNVVFEYDGSKEVVSDRIENQINKKIVGIIKENIDTLPPHINFIPEDVIIIPYELEDKSGNTSYYKKRLLEKKPFIVMIEFFIYTKNVVEKQSVDIRFHSSKPEKQTQDGTIIINFMQNIINKIDQINFKY